MKGGRVGAGIRAAVSHTGAIASDEKVLRDVLGDAGVILVRSPAEMIGAAKLLASGRRVPTSSSAGILCNSGGTSVLAADLASEAGVELPMWSETTAMRLRKLLPEFGGPNNPVDITSHYYEADLIANVTSAIAAETRIGTIVAFSAFDYSSSERMAESIAPVLAASEKFRFAVWLAPSTTIRRTFARHGVPCFTDPALAFHALELVIRGSRAVVEDGMLDGAPALAEGQTTTWTEDRVLSELTTIPTSPRVLASTAQEAIKAATRIGYPVALKAISPEIPHRAKIGALALGLTDAKAVAREYARIVTAAAGVISGPLDGVLVQGMTPAGVEVFIGITRDVTFGPIATLGFGGTLIETLRLAVHAPLPLSIGSAKRLVDRLPGLETVASASQRARLADMLVAVNEWWERHASQVVELDLNPLILSPTGPVLVDGLARMIVSPRGAN
jgi:acyl-CoA synthetase (NDP forming)